ncbi:hypothetical protein SPBR_06000 [Sporothrix brasiliensis 5110]|uniref:Uncharacterized protein n=1 Tax=Sporothrix brasiliensis 5110 TaxID=1398154 RepID=A0A0C2J4G0_9PEZI|nr:uncharacterized protein SPBR_06000 [Sporothrix brasiliensis 5110]KIH93910.1 hypothetical protein SPBR_06000 [Sporothrix brasiliensis 5110]
MTSSPAVPPVPASTTAKRKRRDDDDDDDDDDAHARQDVLSPPPPRPLRPRTTTIALHTAAPRSPPASAASSSPPLAASSATSQFSFITPRPPPVGDGSVVGPEADGASPYHLPLVQTAGLAIAPFVAGRAALDPHDGGGSSPRTHVANRFSSLAIAGGTTSQVEARLGTDARAEAAGDAGDAVDKQPLHKRMRRDGGSEDAKPPAGDTNRVITDPLRASLTWQDDEITVYDPNDADDDGTGVNGIGFKPTPAMAHARALKRRQQLAAYRRREEREARARRSWLRTRANRASQASQGSQGSPAQLDDIGSGSSSQSSLPSLDDVASVSAVASPHTPRAHTTAVTTAALSPPPSSSPAASPSVRRVRFLETGPVTIRFKEPDAVPSPTSIMSS